MSKEFSLIGQGRLYLRDLALATGLLPIGNCSAIKLGITEDKKELKDFTGSGGLANSLSKIDKVELSITMKDFLSSNVALAVFGSDNAIESLNSVIRKAIRNRKIFPHDQSAMKVVYLAIDSASRKWTLPIRNWKPALNRFMIEFEDRMPTNM